MNKDKELEEIFLAQKPQFDDSEAFISSLSKRLDAVEFIKRHQEATLRRYKLAMIAAFVVGIISGAVTIVFVLSAPATIPFFSFQTQTVLLSWFAENARPIVTTALALLMTFGLISIFNNIQDIKSMRSYILKNERSA